MKTWKITVPVIALLVLIAASATASAKTHMSTGSSGTSKGSWTFAIQGGLSKPTGDFNNEAKSGDKIR